NAAFSLTPTGDLWYYGYKIATGVTQPVGYYGINGEQVDYFVGGTAYTAIANLGPTALSNVPS
ncbi:hypothetical protein, partial [Rathayibacter sp. Leaf296]|uniref:hypothetical protein n=1 Tax=Rathayibacter sp. Leaf296 TaxID=1736327 RepID=UPI00138EEC1F